MYRRLSQNMYNADTFSQVKTIVLLCSSYFYKKSALYSNINIDLKRWLWTDASRTPDLDCAYLLGKYPQKLGNSCSYAWIQV